MPDQENQQQQLQIKVPDDMLKGVYANMMQVAHTPEEFILDFMNLFPPAGTLTSRVIISPGHFKRMIAAMQDNLRRYEEQFGKVKETAATSQGSSTSSSDHKYGFRTE